MANALMPEAGETFYVTTPIYYVNARPHIGHAYATVVADAVARFQRLLGRDVLFVTGTDEHGEKVLRAAQQQGTDAQQYVDHVSQEFVVMWERMHIVYDRFIRTTEPEHKRLVQTIFQRLLQQDDIYRGQYEGWYCVRCEAYLRQNEVVDQRCPDCHDPVEWLATEAYFFRTTKYADRLLQHLEEHPEFIHPESRRNEVVGLIKQGLIDSCVSRAASPWGIPVPGDPTQTIYVWLDALTNYLTAAGYLCDEARFARVWPPDVQLVGKDILPRFHGTLWPAMIMALALPLPRTIFAHGWWLRSEAEGAGDHMADVSAKISKSAGDLVDPWDTAGELAEASGATRDVAVDAVRYFLLRQTPVGLDATFSTRAVWERFLHDLANDFGNLLNRTLPLLHRYCDGRIPEPGAHAGALGAEVERTAISARQAMAGLCFSEALSAIWQLLAAGNKLIDERRPWDLYQAGKSAELSGVLYDVLDCLRAAAIMTSPVMPAAAEAVWEQLGLQGTSAQWDWLHCVAGKLPAGAVAAQPQPIFPRFDIKQAAAGGRRAKEDTQVQRAEGAQEQEPAAEDITYDEFMRTDLRVVEVVAAARVPGTDKLVELTVSLGAEQRTVVAGIAQEYEPEALIGRRLVLVANLKPTTIRGVRSHGMVLAAGDEHVLGLVEVEEGAPLGSRVR